MGAIASGYYVTDYGREVLAILAELHPQQAVTDSSEPARQVRPWGMAA